MSKPIEVLSTTYSQLTSDTTMDRATYVRITNIATTTAYDIFVRTVANSGNPADIVGRTIIAPNETFILKKDPDHFVGSTTGNVYASAVSPNP